MIIPYEVDVPKEHEPWANAVIVTMTITISLWALARPALLEKLALGRAPISEYQGYPGFEELPSRALTPANIHYEPYMYVSHGFVHVGILHLLGNMLFLFVFGNSINSKLGNLAYPLVYALLLVLSGMVSVVLVGLPSAGASGAIYGLLGLFVVYFPRNEVRCCLIVFYRIHDHVVWFDVSSVWIIGLWVLTDVLLEWLTPGARAFEAHLGGFVSGFVLGLVLLLSGWVRPTDYEQSILDVFKAR